MAVTNLRSAHLLNKIRDLYPQYDLHEGEVFRWDPESASIYFVKDQLKYPEGVYSLFHELAHAELGHQAYIRDIGLLQMEAEAWQEAYQLAKQCKVAITTDYAEDCLSTYRWWLQQRSTCPSCSQTGLQTNRHTYQCVNCRCVWRVNDAKVCGLKRYKQLMPEVSKAT